MSTYVFSDYVSHLGVCNLGVCLTAILVSVVIGLPESSQLIIVFQSKCVSEFLQLRSGSLSVLSLCQPLVLLNKSQCHSLLGKSYLAIVLSVKFPLAEFYTLLSILQSVIS